MTGQLAIAGNKYGIGFVGDYEDYANIGGCSITGTGSNSYYGVSIEGYDSEKPVVYVSGVQITEFGQGGIYCSGVGGGTFMYAINIYDCGLYGVYLSDS